MRQHRHGMHASEMLTPNSRLPRFVRLAHGACSLGCSVCAKGAPGVGAGRLHPAREFLNERRRWAINPKTCGAHSGCCGAVPMQQRKRDSPTLLTTANAPCASVCRFLPRFYRISGWFGPPRLRNCALAYAPRCRAGSKSSSVRVP
jgi:hypothetical protein